MNNNNMNEFNFDEGQEVKNDEFNFESSDNTFDFNSGVETEQDNPVLSAMKDPRTSQAAIGAGLGQTNSLLDKLINIGQGGSKLMFGSSSKAIGSLLGAGTESAKQLFTGERGEGKFINADGSPKFFSEQSGAGAGVDIAFTALELTPGGGALSKALRKLPGGEFVAKNIADKLAKIPQNMKTQALEQYASIFRAGSKESKALTEKVAPKLLEQGKIVTSMESLKEKATKQARTYGEQIDEWFKELPAGVKKEVSPVVKKLQTLKAQYRISGKDINKTAINAIDETIDSIKTKSGEMSINNLRKLRQIWDEHYSVSKGLDDISGYKKKAERVGANAIREVLAKESPKLDELNKTFSFWKNVEKLADYTSQKAPLKLSSTAAKVVGGTIGAVSGAGVGGKVASTLVGSQIGNMVNKAISSPAWKTISATYKNKVANYMMSESVDKLKGVVRRIITIGKNATE